MEMNKAGLFNEGIATAFSRYMSKFGFEPVYYTAGTGVASVGFKTREAEHLEIGFDYRVSVRVSLGMYYEVSIIGTIDYDLPDETGSHIHERYVNSFIRLDSEYYSAIEYAMKQCHAQFKSMVDGWEAA